MPGRAGAALSRVGLASVGVLPHFVAAVRRRPWQVRKLVDCWQGLTSGGPVTMLDLHRMRTAAVAAADVQWQVWNQVIRGTRPAEPFWVYADRYRDDPARFPLSRMQAQYRAQPRLLAMAAHNTAHTAGGRMPLLPTAAVEAFQAGHQTFVNLAWLAAVPGDGVVPVTGGWLTAASARLVDVLAFLTSTNAHLDELPAGAGLVAMASPLPGGGDR